MKKIYLIIFTLIATMVFCACTQTEPVVPTVAEPDITPEPVTEKRVSFLGVGDNLIHDSVYWQADRNAPGAEYDFKPMYQHVAEDIAAADIACINQETLLGGTELGLSSYPLFNSPQEVGRDMIELGFDVFSQATNHVFDKGEQGLRNTYKFYEENPEATCIGLYKKDEETVKIIEKDGIKIAFVNYTYLTNGFSHPKNSEYHVTLADYKDGSREMISAIKRAKEMADFVVCCVHWGDEGSTTPNKIQREGAQLMADAGCDVIVGTHPHTIQPVEYIGDTLVVYSLGNFISAQKSPINLIGGMISFDFVKKGDEKSIENVIFHPIITQFGPGFKDIRITPFEDYTDKLAAAHRINVSYGYFKGVIDKTIDEQFLDYE